MGGLQGDVVKLTGAGKPGDSPLTPEEVISYLKNALLLKEEQNRNQRHQLSWLFL